MEDIKFVLFFFFVVIVLLIFLGWFALWMLDDKLKECKQLLEKSNRDDRTIEELSKRIRTTKGTRKNARTKINSRQSCRNQIAINYDANLSSKRKHDCPGKRDVKEWR